MSRRLWNDSRGADARPTPEPPLTLASDPHEKAERHPLTPRAAPLAELVLVRHGRPALSRDIRLDWRGYRTWWASYGESGLATGEKPSPQLLELSAKADMIVASPLPRALETAQAIAHGRPIAQNSLFVEAPLPAPRIPFVRLRPGTWGVLSRIFWRLGYSDAGESHKHAEERAAKAASELEQLAAGRKLVILCAHGWFNRMIRGNLRARGWRSLYDGGDSYWAWRRLRAPGRKSGDMR